MWGLALCLLAVSAGWIFMRFGVAWSVVDLPASPNIDYIVPAYIITEVGMIPLGGKLVDLWGCRRLTVLSASLFIIASLLCTLSMSVEMLIVFRLLQGVGAGFILAAAYASVGKYYKPLERGKTSELMMATFAVGSLFGSAFGYFLTNNFNWRAGFIALSLFMAIGMILSWKYLPEDEMESEKLDSINAIIITAVFLIAAMYTQVVNVTFDIVSIQSLFMALVIILGIAVLFWHSKRSANPVMPTGLTIFQKKLLILMFLFSLCGLGLIQYFFKLYLTYYDFDIYAASLMFLLLIAGAAAPSIYGSRKVFTIGIRKFVTTGAVFVTIALIFTHFMADKGVVEFGASLFIFGFGLGFIVGEIICALMNVVDERDMGQHLSNLMTVRMIGILAGNAVVGAYIREMISSNSGNPVLDLSSDSLIKSITEAFSGVISNAAEYLDQGFLTTLLIMAAVTAILAILAYTLEHDDVDANNKAMDETDH